MTENRTYTTFGEVGQGIGGIKRQMRFDREAIKTGEERLDKLEERADPTADIKAIKQQMNRLVYGMTFMALSILILYANVMAEWICQIANLISKSFTYGLYGG